jgi:hypothetical protein
MALYIDRPIMLLHRFQRRNSTRIPQQAEGLRDRRTHFWISILDLLD